MEGSADFGVADPCSRSVVVLQFLGRRGLF